MDGGQEVKPLPRITAVVDTHVKPLFGKLGVAEVAPCLSPFLQRGGVAPVGGGNSVKEGLAVLARDTVAALVQTVDAPLFLPPFAAFVQRTDRAEDMKVRVGYAAFLPVGLVDGEVADHAPADKPLR